MIAKNIIRVSEFEKLYYDNSKPFRQKHWEALCRYLEGINRKEAKRVEYFRILNKGIQFTNFVGVIQAGNLTIEVLPKTDRGAATAANENIENLSGEEKDSKQQWHTALLQMLKECRLLRVHHVDYANLNLRSNSILEIYLELFLAETAQLLHEGLLKKYQKKEGNQPALKGSLLFTKQIAHNSTHEERFYVRYTDYNRDNIYNRILYKTLQLIPRISNSNSLLDMAGRALLDFPEVSPVTATADTFSRLQFDRKTERYKEAMLIAKMLLLNFRPDITGGSENVIAILFDMNKLWEEWVYRRLKKEESKFDIIVHRQQSASFWDPSLISRPKTIRPDIVVERKDTGQVIVIDTKWKILDDLIPSDEDLKQMFVYNLFWKCSRSILLYPFADLNHNHGDYYDYIDKNKHHSKCTVLTICILNKENKLDGNFGSVLIGELLRRL